MRSLLAVHSPRRRRHWLLAIACLALAPACKSAPTRETRRVDRTVITRDQMLDGSYVTVYDAVAALRSLGMTMATYLQPRERSWR